jgi:hypothetical protein
MWYICRGGAIYVQFLKQYYSLISDPKNGLLGIANTPIPSPTFGCAENFQCPQ